MWNGKLREQRPSKSTYFPELSRKKLSCCNLNFTWHPFAAMIVVVSKKSTIPGLGRLVERLQKSEVFMIRRCSELSKVVMSAESGLSLTDPQIGGAERDPACACILNRPWLKKASVFHG